MDIMSCCILNPVLFNQKKVPQWFVIILILLSRDIHVNPGPYCENNLKFMNWNVKITFNLSDLWKHIMLFLLMT